MSGPNIVLVGAGRFGMNHLRVWRKLEKEGFCALVGVVDSRLDILEDIKRSYSIPASPDLTSFLTEDVDAIDVVTPTNTHFDIGIECLNAGKHVLLEKPLTASYAEASELVNVSRQQKRILMVGHIFRYNSALREIKKLIDKGELGDVYYFFGHFMGIKDPRTDVGALYNYAVHHVDAYNYLINDLPQEITCTVGYFLGRAEFEDLAILTLKYPSGTVGHVEGSWLPPGKCRDLVVVGSRKSVTSDLLEQKLLLHENHMEVQGCYVKAVDNGTTEIKVEFKEPLELELLDFINSINTGQKPLANEQTALDVIRIMEKGLESAKLRKTVSLS